MPSNSKKKKQNQLQLYGVLLFLLLAVSAFIGFSHYLEARDLTSISFIDKSGDKTSPSILVEVVSTPDARAKGLMYVKPGELKEDRGMLFVFPRSAIQSFWMKNTYLSLDIIFIDSSKKVVGVLPNVPPLNSEKRRISEQSIYVLELNAGGAAQYGITVGSTLEVSGDLPKAIE